MTAMFCPNCGTQRIVDALFCSNCGNRFETTRRCPTCNQVWPETQNPRAQNFANLQANPEVPMSEKFAYGEKFNPDTDCSNCGSPNSKENCAVCA